MRVWKWVWGARGRISARHPLKFQLVERPLQCGLVIQISNKLALWYAFPTLTRLKSTKGGAIVCVCVRVGMGRGGLLLCELLGPLNKALLGWQKLRGKLFVEVCRNQGIAHLLDAPIGTGHRAI